uniref:Ig-like domain-containing protein n=1 Tax=Esox lucius TaxID=8010 RepID=A0A3P9AIG9_ESOLU
YVIDTFLKWVSAAQSSAMRLVSANIGDTVTLQCFRDNLGLNFMWYKQTLGDKPKILSNFYAYKENPAFHNEFKKNSRFSVLCGQGMYHLNISDTQLSDSASYYCGRSHINDFNFLDGAILIVKGSESKNTGFVRQPESKSVQPGDSVTLNCTINTGTCEGEHSVYWFRLDSGESHPGIIYTNGDRSGQCMKSPESGSPTQSCVYNLPKRNLSLSDTGTYYCAVASCGEILFGNGTKLDVQGNFQNSDVLNYAAVRFNPKKSSSARRVKDKTVRRDAVYSEVRYLQQE